MEAWQTIREAWDGQRFQARWRGPDVLSQKYGGDLVFHRNGRCGTHRPLPAIFSPHFEKLTRTYSPSEWHNVLLLKLQGDQSDEQCLHDRRSRSIREKT
jgi:hypothetical protein